MKESDEILLYAFAKEFDLSILKGIDSINNGETLFNVWYLGQPSEISAGIYGRSVSPFFKTLEELLCWIEENQNSLYAEFVTPYLFPCEICNADMAPSKIFLWHYADEDCRAVHQPI